MTPRQELAVVIIGWAALIAITAAGWAATFDWF